MLQPAETKIKQQFLKEGSTVSDLINRKDWSKTPLGPIDTWPQSLKTSVNLILNSQHPMWIGWGPEASFLYNDAYIQVLSAAKHPWALGRPASEVWEEIWDVCGPLADKVFQHGEPTYLEDVRLFMSRGTYTEETYYSFSYSPIYDEGGKVSGLFCPSAETTAKVLHTRRLRTLSELSSNSLIAKTTRAACASAFETIKKNPDDIPFALLYLVDNDKMVAHLAQDTRTSRRPDELFPRMVFLNGSEQQPNSFWQIAEVAKSKRSLTLDLSGAHGLPIGCDGNSVVSEAIVLPVSSPGFDAPIGILVAGISPCLKLDNDYHTFLDLLANQIAVAIQNARSAEEERKRIEMLAEIDRAKTAFFNNVSHEFRTPLTLMLGPVESIINESIHLLPEEHQEGLQSTHRNAMRLFRLVNTLLDFSRIEAGRIHASFAKVDLATITNDLASNFRSVVERSGLGLNIDCKPLPENVFVDAEMWEKIVFNLLSNAFKYTLKGDITVRIFQDDSHAVLEVEDTGIGIPAHELPKIFERFHRVQHTAGRTFEGTGIGLSLVSELVCLHKGTISAASVEGQGTTFTARIPLGKDHLPVSQISDAATESRMSMADVYVKDLESVMGSVQPSRNGKSETPGLTTQKSVNKELLNILVVDDNADMRQYIRRLLSPAYDITEANNGQEALTMLTTLQPSLIISDIMMPVMDGIQLLHKIKHTPALARIPVILLSARAGEEARIEGYDLGADDYLVKPFSANELIARVKAQIRISKIRQNAENHLRNFFQQAPVTIVVFRGPDFVIEIANEKLLEYWGKTLDQVMYKPLLEVLPEIANQGLIELLTKVRATGERHIENEREVPFIRNGKMETTYVSYVYEPLRDEEGKIDHVMVLAHEVTDSVVARKSIERSEAKFRNLVMQAPVGIAIIRRENFIVEIANEHYLKIANRTADELVGKPFFDVLTELRDGPLRDFFQYVLDKGEPYFGSEFPVDFYRNHVLERAYFNFVYQPWIQNDEVVGIIGIVHEVSDIVGARKIAQELAVDLEQRVAERTRALKVSNEKLEASNRELEQFAYIASHDLQEPLRKIQTFSELLQRNAREPAVVEKYINKIDTSASRMSVLIRDVLNYSRLSKTDETFQSVDLNHILANVKSDFELFIQETNATIRHGKLPVIRGVALQLHQLFSNLIGNSLKFRNGEPPVIEISSHVLSGAELENYNSLLPSKKYVRLTFADNGIGFEQAYAEKIFVIFQRLNYSGKHEGTGIGLALCKKIVENHGGEIEAEGALNKGAKFHVILPVE